MTQIKRKRFITTIVLILCILVFLTNNTVFANGETDRTEEAWFKLETLRIGSGASAQVIIADGGSVNNNDLILENGTSFFLTATWGANDTAGWKAGDYMTFDLPMSDVINYAPENGNLNDEYGTWQIYPEGGGYKVKFTMAQPALLDTALNNGKFETRRTVKDLGVDGNTGITTVDSVLISWYYSEAPTPNGPYSHFPDISKENWGFSAIDNTLTYVLRFNGALVAARFNALANSSGSWLDASENPNKRENVIIVDKLPENVKLADDLPLSDMVTFNIYLRGPYNNAGTIVQSNTDYYSRSVGVSNRKINQTNETTWEEFRITVEAGTAPCYGIYESSNEGTYIIINLGEVAGGDSFLEMYKRLVPGTSITTMRGFLEANLSPSGTTDENIAARKAHADTWLVAAPDVYTDNMNVWNYTFTVKTRKIWVDTDLEPTKIVTNTATMYYDDSEEDSDSTAATYRRSSASIELSPGQLYLLKADANTQMAIPNTVFSIQKYKGTTKTAAAAWADADNPDAWEESYKDSTGSTGILKWTGVVEEVYRVVEVTASDGYDAGSFELFDIDGNALEGGIFAMPTDKGVVVFATNERLPVELILEGTKTLIGRTLRDGEFEFELYGENGYLESTATNDVTGKIVFEPIEYTHDDADKTFTYKVKEVKGSLAGVTYDTTEFEISVTVTADKTGRLEVAVEYPENGIVFSNKYYGGSGNRPSGGDDDYSPDPTPDIESEPDTEPKPDTEPNPPEPPYTPGGADPDVPPIPNIPGNRLIPDGDGWIELDEDGVPLGKWDWDDEEEIWIFDEEVPLGDIPYTGDNSRIAYLFSFMVLSFLGLYVILKCDRRKHGKYEHS